MTRTIDLVSPETLQIGDKFRLTGVACDDTERDDKNVYEIVNKNTACATGAHLIVRDDAGGPERETRIMPWVKVWKVRP